MSLRETASRGLMGMGKLAFKVLPRGIRKDVEDRFFSAVFQMTRVTNDAYGWRPDQTDLEGEQDGGPEEG